MAISGRSASVGIHDSNSMHGFRDLAKEIPHSIWIKYVLDWMRFQSMEKVRCLNGIPKEENWEVNSYHVINSIFSIML